MMDKRQKKGEAAKRIQSFQDWTRQKLLEDNRLENLCLIVMNIMVMLGCVTYLAVAPMVTAADSNAVKETVVYTKNVEAIKIQEVEETVGIVKKEDFISSQALEPKPNTRNVGNAITATTMALKGVQPLSTTSMVAVHNKEDATEVVVQEAPKPIAEPGEEYVKTVYVSATSGLNIRAHANENSEIINTVPYGTAITVTKKIGDWLKTSDGTYVSERFTQLEQPSGRCRYLGNFRLTAYCTCPICCGKWSKYGKTRTGTTPTEGRTISVDPKVIPLGSKVIINGHEYTAEDTGSAIHGNRIDVYIDGHSNAQKFGVQMAEVYAAN